MWKTVTFIFQTVLLWEVIISVVFWIFIWPGMHPPSEEWWVKFLGTGICLHLIPILLLLIEYGMNRIYFEWQQIWW